MPARYSRISWRTSSTLSRTTYFVPSTRKATVSGWASTRSMRSGLSAKPSPFRRVTRITVGPLVDGAGPRGRGQERHSPYRLDNALALAERGAHPFGGWGGSGRRTARPPGRRPGRRVTRGRGSAAPEVPAPRGVSAGDVLERPP